MVGGIKRSDVDIISQFSAALSCLSQVRVDGVWREDDPEEVKSRLILAKLRVCLPARI